MLNRPLSLGVRHRALIIDCWERLGSVTFGLFMVGIILLLISLCAGNI